MTAGHSSRYSCSTLPTTPIANNFVAATIPGSSGYNRYAVSSPLRSSILIEQTSAEHGTRHGAQQVEQRIHVSQSPSAWTSYAWLIGGASFVVMYIQQQFIEPQFAGEIDWSKVPPTPMFMLNAIFFTLALVFIALGLLGVGSALRRSAPKLAASTQIGATITIITAVMGLTMRLGVWGQVPLGGSLNGTSVILTLLSTTVLGIAAFRTRTLQRSISLTLIGIGLITFPVILLTFPLEAVLPPYVIADLPFAVWGTMFAAIGYALLRSPRPTTY